MARKAKVLTEYDKECRKKSGERLEVLKKERGLTTVSLAKELHIADSTLRNYIHGRKELDPDVTRTLESRYGRIALWWSGQTDATTWGAYYIEQQEIESAGADEYTAAVEAEKQRLSMLFSCLGYNYQDLSGSAEFDFSSFLSQSPYHGITGQHQLTDTKTLHTTPVYLSQAELDTLIAQLREVVGYFCFKHTNQEQP